MAKTPLRLLAHDAEDLEIFSVFLQDAVLRVGDMAYMPKSRRFAAVVNRYCWEGDIPTLRGSAGEIHARESAVLSAEARSAKAEALAKAEAEEERPCLRTHAGLHFENVMRVRTLDLPQDQSDAVLELLALRFVPGEDGAGSIVFFLAGGAVIRLDVECIDATLVDLAEPRPAKQRPRHDLEAGS